MSAVETWDMLYGHGTCLVGEEYMVSSCWRRIYGYGRCLLVRQEDMAMEDVFLLDKNMDMEDVFFLEKNI